MKFCVVNLGCKVNRVESDSMTACLLASGAHAASPDDADVIIVNTCTVTGEAEKKTRKAIRRSLRENTHAFVLVTGCAASIAAHDYETMDGRIIVQTDKDLVVRQAWKAYDPFSPVDQRRAHTVSAREALPFGEAYRTRIGVKVQDGCDQACTFCIVHKARGASWSRPFNDIVSEIETYEALGAQEIVLTGINLGSYSYEGNGLTDLLQSLMEATSYVRFRLSSIEPPDVDAELIDLLVQAQGRICRHIHLPVQSGSSKVIAEMGRPYDRPFVEDLAARLYEALPMLALTADIIVGFPGEDDGDFVETMSLVRACRFSKVHVFPYSRRKGTPAAERPDQVDPLVKKQRAKDLSVLSDEMRACDRASRCGTQETALVEKHGVATTESYHRMAVPDDLEPGSLVSVTFR